MKKILFEFIHDDTKKTHQSSLEDAKKPTARDNHEQPHLLSLNFLSICFWANLEVPGAGARTWVHVRQPLCQAWLLSLNFLVRSTYP